MSGSDDRDKRLGELVRSLRGGVACDRINHGDRLMSEAADAIEELLREIEEMNWEAMGEDL